MADAWLDLLQSPHRTPESDGNAWLDEVAIPPALPKPGTPSPAKVRNTYTFVT